MEKYYQFNLKLCFRFFIGFKSNNSNEIKILERNKSHCNKMEQLLRKLLRIQIRWIRSILRLVKVKYIVKEWNGTETNALGYFIWQF